MFSNKNKMSLALALGRWSLLGMVLTLALYPSIAQGSETPKKVLIFSGTDPGLPSVVLVSQILRSTLEKGSLTRIQFYSESLDNHRIPGEKYELEMIKLLQRKYEGEKIDLIFTLSSAGLKFLLKHKSELFPDVPKVFIHTDDHEGEGLDLGQNITGVQSRLELGADLDLALSLHPGTRRVVVVTGNSSIDRFRESVARKEFQPLANKLELVYLTNLNIEELRNELRSQPNGTIVFFLSFLLDREGNGYSLPESVSLIAPASSAPVYVAIQSAFGPGVVGGRMISYEALAKAGGELGLRILNGEQLQQLPPQNVPSVAMFDWRELQRWGIAERSLPPGSILLNKEASVWQLYKWRIIGTIALIVTQTIGIILLLFVQAKRRQAEKKSASLAKLAEAEHQHLDEIVANVPGVVWEAKTEASDAGLQTTFISPYLEKMLGYTPEEWVKKAGLWSSIVSDEDRSQAQTTISHVLETGKEGTLQARLRTKDERVVWVESHVTAIRDEQGQSVGLRGVTMDISDRRQAEVNLERALEEVSQLKNKLEEENVYLQEEIKLAHNFDEIVGRSDATKYVLFKIEQVAPTDSTVLITGETGTGKELVARAIHKSSSRKERPLVRVNCAALSPTLIESELFGHEKGSFTGATARKLGRFELANGGTIFLDEIGELPLELQSKLLRVIQEGEFERLGATKTIKVDARIIAATNRNLRIAVEQGIFREDLWYRLNVFPITVPPLRDRKEDIPGLVEHFVRKFSGKLGKQISSISPGSLRMMKEREWPGNIRELANVVERAMINTEGSLLKIVDQVETINADEGNQSSKTLEEIEREYIVRILNDTGWRIDGSRGAAKILGLNPSTLRTRMNKLGIRRPEGTLTSTA